MNLSRKKLEKESESWKESESRGKASRRTEDLEYFEDFGQAAKPLNRSGMEKQVGFSRKMEDLDGVDQPSKPSSPYSIRGNFESLSLDSPRVEFDSSEPLGLNSPRYGLNSPGFNSTRNKPPLSLNSTRHDFTSVEPLSLDSPRHEPLSLNSTRYEFDSVEPLSLEYEYEIEGLGRPQQQEHCAR